MRKRINIFEGDVLKVIHHMEDKKKKKELLDIIEDMEGNQY